MNSFCIETDFIPRLAPWYLSILMVDEYWRPIKNFTNYAVSNYGRIRSKRKGGYFYLKLMPQIGGYLWVDLKKKGERKYGSIHCLVMAAFVAPRWFGLDIHHKDRNRQKNWVDNLIYLTTYEHHKLHKGDRACQMNS